MHACSRCQGMSNLIVCCVRVLYVPRLYNTLYVARMRAATVVLLLYPKRLVYWHIILVQLQYIHMLGMTTIIAPLWRCCQNQYLTAVVWDHGSCNIAVRTVYRTFLTACRSIGLDAV